ncbi:DNA-binding transcriptional regulator, LysR family [Atopomonas hussainii]|uniref:DNA-binding transcriptional regulator, LysR family n=1 Tax=Atopomonas hussainii TaxID=1429083 RepID=A0A1H7F722_9GAMM|nr:LysR family transcriptional regulator [Atopomonas hussainii]SEK21899.1 DNA-binding transcriptional regulator, LysR family [Atopomonas hussainii]
MRKELTRITFRQLEVFRAVCEHLSYSRAAEAMALTQPAVSLQIKQLEELLGQPLFDYVGKKLHLTPAAEALLATCEQLLSQLQALDMRLSTLQGALQGTLQLAAESSAKYLTPHLFAAFRAQHPKVSLSLTVTNRAQLIRRLGDNRDDLTLMSQPPQDMALEFFPLLDNPIVAVAPAGHPLSHAAQLPLSALENYPLLSREPGSGTRKAVEEFLQQQRVHFKQGMELMSLEAQREGVLAGLGLALLPRHAVRGELGSGQLLELPVEGLPFKRSWCLLYPRQKRLSPVAEAFYRFCQQERLNLQRQLA